MIRYNLPPDPSQQPSRIKRAKSQPKLSEAAEARNPSRLRYVHQEEAWHKYYGLEVFI